MTADQPLIVCQARVGSTRLPRKVLLPLSGAPLLIRFIERVRRSKYANNFVVATTTDRADNVLVDLCKENNFPYYRGHATDLLDRHVMCGKEFDAKVLVKIPTDCPLIDPGVIDRVIGAFYSHDRDYDYVSNLHRLTSRMKESTPLRGYGRGIRLSNV